MLDVMAWAKFTPPTIICTVSPTNAFVLNQPIKSISVAPVRSMSPVAAFSIAYSSVTAEPVPIIAQPFAVSKARSLT